MAALRMALVTLIGVCAAVTYEMRTFNGASLIGVLAVLALLSTSEIARDFWASLVDDDPYDAPTTLDVLDRPGPHMHVEYTDGTQATSGLEHAARDRAGRRVAAPGECPCPVDHTDACPFDDDLERPAA